MEEKDSKPQPATEDEITEDELGQPPLMKVRKSGKMPSFGGSNIPLIAFISLAASAIVFTLMGQFGGGSLVSKKDFTTNLANVTSTITQTVTDLTSWENTTKKSINESLADITRKQADATVAIQNIPTTVNNTVNQSLSTYSNQLTNLANQVNGYSSSIQTNTNKVNEMSSTVTDLTTKLNTANKTISDLAKTVSEQNTTITSYESRIKTLEALHSGTTTPTTGQVIATVLGNTFTGSQLIAFDFPNIFNIYVFSVPLYSYREYIILFRK